MDSTERRKELQRILVLYVENPSRLGKVIRDIENLFDPPHDPNDRITPIIDEVCKKYQATIEELQGDSRAKIFTRARNEIIGKLYDIGITYVEMGRVLNRHTSTIHHSLRLIGKI